MQLGKSGAQKKDLIQSRAGRLHLPQIDFCKSRVSNIPSQNALIESSLRSISGYPLPDPRPRCRYRPKKNVFHNPSALIHPRLSRQASLGRDAPLCADCPDDNLLSQQHQQEEWVFQYPVHTLAHPSLALHQEIEEGGGIKKKKKKKANSLGRRGGEMRPSVGTAAAERGALGVPQCSAR